MFKKIIVVFLLIINLSAKIDYQFPDHEEKDAAEFVEDLAIKYNVIKRQITKTYPQLIPAAIKNKDYLKALAMQKILCVLNSNSYDDWLNHGLIIYLIINDDNPDLVKDSWEFRHDLKHVAIQAFNLAKTDQQQALALMLYSASLSCNYDFQKINQILALALDYLPLTELKTKYPDIAKILDFKFIKFVVDTEKNPITIDLTFSQKINDKNINQYVTITPDFSGEIKVTDNHIYLIGCTAGKTYEVNILENLTSIHGNTLTKTKKIEVKVPDQSSRISMLPNAYVFSKNQELLLPIHSINVDKVSVELLKFTPNNILNILKLLDHFNKYDYRDLLNKANKVLFSGEMELIKDFTKNLNQSLSYNIPLADILKQPESALYCVLVKQNKKTTEYYPESIAQFFIITDLGISSYKTEGGMQVLVRSLATGEPVKGTEVKLISKNHSELFVGQTNSDGYVQIDKASISGTKTDIPRLLLVSKDGDCNFLRIDNHAIDLSDFDIGGKVTQKAAEAFLFTERDIYRPGEKIAVNLLLRNENNQAVANTPVILQIFRPDGVKIMQEVVTTNDLGYGTLDFATQPSFRNGAWEIKAFVDPTFPAIGHFSFTIDDFTPNRLLVEVSSKDRNFVPNQVYELLLDAQYLFGAKASQLSGQCNLFIKPDHEPFSKYSSYHFGLVESFVGQDKHLNNFILDKNGQAKIKAQIPPLSQETYSPLMGKIQATVQEDNGKTSKGNFTANIFPQPFYIGLKANTLGNPQDQVVEIVVIDKEQKPQANQTLNYEVVEQQIEYTWSKDSGSNNWGYNKFVSDKFFTKGQVKIQEDGTGKINLKLNRWSDYRLTVTEPKSGIKSAINLNFGFGKINNRYASPNKMRLALDKKNYQSGDTVNLSLDAPFAGEATLMVCSHNILHQENIHLKAGENHLNFNLNKEWQRGVYVIITAFRPLPATPKSKDSKEENSLDLVMPKRAVAIAWVPIIDQKKLDVILDLPEQVRPNSQVTIPVTVNGIKDQKVSLWLGLVDKGITSLTDFKAPNPNNWFVAKYQLSLEIHDIYNRIIDPIDAELGVLKTGGDSSLLAKRMSQYRNNKLLSQTYKDIEVKNGKASIKVNIPEDYNGTAEIFAVVFGKEQLGSANGQLKIVSPVVLDVITPQELSTEESAKIYITLHNITGNSGEYEVYCNKKFLKKMVLEIGDKQLVELNLKPKRNYSKPYKKIKILVKGPNDFTMQRTVEIPIVPILPMEYREKLIKVKEGETISIKIKEDFKQLLAPQVTIKCTYDMPWSIEKTVTDCGGFSYGCTEQIICQALGFLWNSNQAKDAMELNRNIALLIERQLEDGSFSTWQSIFYSDNRLSCLALDLLQTIAVANTKIDVPNIIKEKSIEYNLNQFLHSDRKNLEVKALILAVLSTTNKIENLTIKKFIDLNADTIKYPSSLAHLAYASWQIGDEEKTKELFAKAVNLLPKFNISKDVDSNFYTNYKIECFSTLRRLAEVLPKLPSLKDLFNQVLGKAVYLMGNNPKNSPYEAYILLQASRAMLGHNPSSKKHDFSVTYSNNTHHNKTQLQLADNDLDVPVTIKNNGEEPLWVNLVIAGHPEQLTLPENKVTNNFKRSFFTTGGKEIDLKKVKLGQEVIVVISGKLTKNTAGSIVYTDQIPHGLEVSYPKLLGKEQQIFKDLIAVKRVDFRKNIVIAVLDSGNFKFAYKLRAVTSGNFNMVPARLENMAESDQFSLSEDKVKTVTIKTYKSSLKNKL